MATDEGAGQHDNHGYEAEHNHLNGYLQNGNQGNENVNTSNGHAHQGYHGNEHETNGHVVQGDQQTQSVAMETQVAAPADSQQTVISQQPQTSDPTQITIVTQTSTEPLCHEPSGQNEAKVACILGLLVCVFCGVLFGFCGMIIAFSADRAYKKGRYAAARSRRNASVACSISGVAIFMVAIVIIIIIFTRKSDELEDYHKLSE